MMFGAPHVQQATQCKPLEGDQALLLDTQLHARNWPDYRVCQVIGTPAVSCPCVIAAY